MGNFSKQVLMRKMKPKNIIIILMSKIVKLEKFYKGGKLFVWLFVS